MVFKDPSTLVLGHSACWVERVLEEGRTVTQEDIVPTAVAHGEQTGQPSGLGVTHGMWMVQGS